MCDPNYYPSHDIILFIIIINSANNKNLIVISNNNNDKTIMIITLWHCYHRDLKADNSVVISPFFPTNSKTSVRPLQR